MKNGLCERENKSPRIYLDNACTTYPKPPRVAQAVYEYMTGVGMNVNRGSYAAAYQAEEMVYETRSLLCELFHGKEPRNVIFTKNITESLNILLKGLLKRGDHVLVSSMEHNAVMRPLMQLKAEREVEFTRIPCTEGGELCLHRMEESLTPRTRAVVMLHASNVCGTVLPLKEVGAFCKKHGLLFIVDAAQTAGVMEIDIGKMNIDALAFTGHKGLLGPQGTGGFLLRDGLGGEMEPLLSGGTGSFSHLETVPQPLPDRFEPGTLNLPGICGLREGLLWLRETGIEEVGKREEELTARFLSGLSSLEEQGLIRLAGLRGLEGRVGVISVRTLRRELSEVAWELDETYGIQTRVGLHCAPSAHRTLGTFPEGTIRFSVGYFTTPEEIDTAVWALTKASCSCDGRDLG